MTDPSDPNALHQLFCVAKERPTRDSTSAKLSFARSDRDHGLKKLLAECPRTHRGDAPRTKKGKEWEAALPTLDAHISNLYMSSNGTDIWTKQNILKLRHNCFYTATAKLYTATAKLYKRGGDGRCPLCRNINPSTRTVSDNDSIDSNPKRLPAWLLPEITPLPSRRCAPTFYTALASPPATPAPSLRQNALNMPSPSSK